jgi:hypothetical protein
MGLLAKASRGTAAPERRGPALHEAPGKAECESATPEESRSQVPAPEIGRRLEARLDPAKIETLALRIVALQSGAERLISIFPLLSASIPFELLILLQPQGDSLAVAAAEGLAEAEGRLLPSSMASHPTSPGGVLPDDTRAKVAEYLGLGEGGKMRAIPVIRPADARVHGLWLYESRALDASSLEGQEALAKALALAPDPDETTVELAGSKSVSVDKALGPLSGIRHATALVFDLAEIRTSYQAKYPGITAAAFDATAVAVAGRVLASTGRALLAEGEKLVCVLGSASDLDPELVLYQCAKSLKRSSAIMSPGPQLTGRCLCFDPASPESRQALARFIAG